MNEEIIRNLIKKVDNLELEIDSLKNKNKIQDEELRSLRYGSRMVGPTIETRVSSLLLSLGIPKNLKGYLYLKEAIAMVFEDIKIVGSLVKVVYAEIAERHETTASCVERAMRNAIKMSWTSGNQEAKKALFGQVMLQMKAPMNKLYIVTCADYLRQQHMEHVYQKEA